MSTDVGAKKIFMANSVKRKMNAIPTPVFMETVKIAAMHIVVIVFLGTLESTVKWKQMNVNQILASMAAVIIW